MTQEDTLAGATLYLFLLKNIWRFSNYDSMKIPQMASSSKLYFFWRTLFFGKYVILVCLSIAHVVCMLFMGRLDTPSFEADLNAWIVVLCSENEEYRETVELTS